MRIVIDIPPALRRHVPSLKAFFEGMVFKLNVNSFKDDINAKSVDILIQRGLDELTELRAQLSSDMDNPNTLSELFDMSNFNYLLFQYLRTLGVKDEREQFVDDFFTVDIKSGKVFASKTRSGSRYKAGDEIKGTKRNGKTHIRVQHAANGSLISCARADIVWYAAKGRWPDREITHGALGVEFDGIDNLAIKYTAEGDFSEDYPFVFERENESGLVDYGYQRRHRGVLLRVGYWGDKATAAREGVSAWKKKSKEMDNTDV